MYFVKNLQFLRKKKGLTQKEFGKKLKKGVMAVSSYETGLSKPTYDTFIFIAEYFNVNLHDFVYKDLSLENPSESGRKGIHDNVELLE